MFCPFQNNRQHQLTVKFIAPTSSDKLLTSSDPEQLALSSFCSAGTMKTINGVLYGAIHSDCHFFVCSSIEFYPIKGFWFINLLLSLSKVSDACVFTAACGLFALAAGGFKTQGVILLEVMEKFEDEYGESTLLWIFTVAFFVDSLSGKPY